MVRPPTMHLFQRTAREAPTHQRTPTPQDDDGRPRPPPQERQQQQNEKEPANPPSPTKNISKVSDEKAALATITSAIASESSSFLTVTVNQKPGEPSTEDSSKAASAPKMVKVKTADKNHGNPIGNFFGGIVRGVQSLQSLVRPPCLKSIEQQVVVGNEHLKMKEQLEMDAKK